MYIKVDKTQNENTLHFTISQNLPFQGEYKLPLSQQSIQKTEHQKTIENILQTEGVESIVSLNNLLSVSKSPTTPWGQIKPKILSSIVKMLEIETPNNQQENRPESLTENNHQKYQPKNKLEEDILSAINKRVRPSIQSHGGDIEFLGVEEDKVKIKLKGACVGCASSNITLKEGIEKMITTFFPSIKEVVQK